MKTPAAMLSQIQTEVTPHASLMNNAQVAMVSRYPNNASRLLIISKSAEECVEMQYIRMAMRVGIRDLQSEQS